MITHSLINNNIFFCEKGLKVRKCAENTSLKKGFKYKANKNRLQRCNLKL